MKLKTLRGKYMVKLDQPKESIVNGVVIPATRFANEVKRGVVLGVGLANGPNRDGFTNEPEAKVGDSVAFTAYDAPEMLVDGSTLLFVDHDAVFTVIEE